MLLGLLQSAAATALLAIFLLPPGFLLGWFSNVLGFRAATGSERTLISATLSLATVPTIAVTMERFAGKPATLAAFLLAMVISWFLLWKERRAVLRRPIELSPATRVGLLMMLVWVAIALLSAVDWQIGERLYPSTIIYDHYVRVSMVGTVLRDGVPPLNPFFHLGGSPNLRYYYYWYVVAALPGQLAGLPARACLNGSIVWAGFGLASLLPLFFKHFTGERENLRRKALVGIALLLVTGLDLIAFAIFCSRVHFLISDMEWWDPNQVTSWMGSLLWVPHHVGALIACMTSLLVLFTAESDGMHRSAKPWAILLGGLAFASAAGLSLYVTFSFAVFCALWMLVLAFQRRVAALLTWLSAAALSLALAAPYLRDLLTKTSGAGARFAVFSFRDFPPAIDFLMAHGVANAAVLDFAKIPIIIFVYLVEFGFFACVSVIQFRRHALGREPLRRWQHCAWLLFGACLFVVTVFKSDTTGSNDLGFRGILPVQFVLLLWAAPMVFDLTQSKGAFRGVGRAVLYTTLLIGVAGTLCQLALLRGFSWYVDTFQKPRAERFLQMSEIGSHAYFLQSGFAELDGHVPRSAIYQLDIESPATAFIDLYAGHAFAAGDPGCGADFGGDPQLCRAALPSLTAPFQRSLDDPTVDSICGRYGIDVLIVTDLDPLWQEKSSWIWQRPPVVANQRMRALPCGRSAP